MRIRLALGMVLSVLVLPVAASDIAGCYFQQHKGVWMDSELMETNVVLIKQDGRDLLVRAEFNGHHACRIAAGESGKAVRLQPSGKQRYTYHGKDKELGIDCELELVESAAGFVISDKNFQCQRLWECGAAAGVGFEADYASKDQNTTRCDQYLGKH
ncbi:MAG: hypothetical protein OEZ39_05840 [Gammaproteobacteria bacterium]|nr:hypothetical protein [Gammaproteobacteria bacterium]MDH5651375.1 hypothetical protein [Gammaproteobacteria bacterium]